jgi:general secretion pathway protein G
MSRKSTFRWVSLAIVGAAVLLVYGLLDAKAVFQAVEKAKKARTQVILAAAATASRSYYTEYSRWPNSLADFTNNPRKILFIQWPASGPRDRWGNPLIYIPFDTARGYGLVSSYGRDGKPGGDGDDADIEVRFNEKGTK